ncbi:MAG: YafY family transcriptional regulator [Oscillospiraceae bacterium]|nr:YafY family transcriptional regulator [Oscillospiraceae bacterium]
MKLDRLMGLLTVLLQRDKVTARELAARFEVSRRTILRDVDALCLAGIPIVTTRGGDGGIAIMEGYKINKGVLTGDELQMLITGLKSMDSISETAHFERLMAKLTPKGAAVSPDSSLIIDLSAPHKDSLTEKISLLKQAIAQRKTVAFDYYYPKGEMRREIEPYQVEFRWRAWYVFGFCPLRQAFRRFALSRLWNPQITDHAYAPRPVPAAQQTAEDAFPERHHLTILFDKSVRFRLIETYGPACYEERDDGLLLDLEYTNKDWTFAWILGFGDKAQVIAPPEARDALAEMTKKLWELYARI